MRVDKISMIASFAIFCLIIIIIILLFDMAIGDTSEVIVEKDIVTIYEGDDVYHFKMSRKDSKIVELTKDGKEDVIKIFEDIQVATISQLILPEVEGIYNIEKEKPISALTWRSSPSQSSKYLNFLREDKWNTVRHIITPKYNEIYISKDGEYRRLVIFNDVLMTGTFVNIENMPHIESYINAIDSIESTEEVEE